MKRFVFTCGDINGIGPEIVVKTINRIYNKYELHSGQEDYKIIFICPVNIFKKTILYSKPVFKYNIYSRIYNEPPAGEVAILDLGEAGQDTGLPTKTSGRFSFDAIKKSYELISQNLADAVITAPISKFALSLAGINYPGHTEMFAEWSSVLKYNMIFLSERLICALVTIHEPLKEISSLITTERINNSIDVCAEFLLNDLLVPEPKIAVLALNPHAGENGLLGSEEKTIINPAIQNSVYKEFISGPFVPDAFFANKLYRKFDIVLGMYHDQVLIPFKLLNFNSGVNYTAGLPFIRTSPDHGTAFDIAGKNIADESSMTEAFFYAERILNNRQHNIK